MADNHTNGKNGGMELIVIGTTEFLPGFALAGVRKTVLASPKDVMTRIKEHSSAGVIILDETLTQGLSPFEIESLETSIQPVIITLAKDSREQETRLRRTIIGTLGVDLLK